MLVMCQYLGCRIGPADDQLNITIWQRSEMVRCFDVCTQMVEAASKDQLKYMCRFRKLQVSGTKKDLIARLVPFTIAIET